MHLISPEPEHTVTTPNGVMTRLATPSLGSSALSTWRVRTEPGARGPLHTVDREQVWTVTAGTLTFITEDRTETATAGQTAVLPAHLERRVHTGDEPAEALVAMPAGGLAGTPGADARPLPWAV